MMQDGKKAADSVEFQDLVNEIPTIIKDLTDSGIDLKFCRKILDNLNDGVVCTDAEQRIIYWNQAAEKITGFRSTDMLQQCHPNELLMALDEQGNSLSGWDCILAKTLLDGEVHEREMFLHHQGGHRVPIFARAVPIFGDDQSIIGAAEIFINNYSVTTYLRQMEQLRENMLLDPLTGIGNRRFADIAVYKRLEELRRYPDTGFGVLLIDVDGLRNVNEEYGFQIGDQVLVMVAKTLEKNIRLFDSVYRWDGQRFLVLAINLKEDELASLAERLRMLVEWSYLRDGTEVVKVTASVGGTAVMPSDTVHSLVNRIESLLTQSKEAGKNKVSF